MVFQFISALILLGFYSVHSLHKECFFSNSIHSSGVMNGLQYNICLLHTPNFKYLCVVL